MGNLFSGCCSVPPSNTEAYTKTMYYPPSSERPFQIVKGHIKKCDYADDDVKDGLEILGGCLTSIFGQKRNTTYLADCYHAIYLIASIKDMTVNDVWEQMFLDIHQLPDSEFINLHIITNVLHKRYENIFSDLTVKFWHDSEENRDCDDQITAAIFVALGAILVDNGNELNSDTLTKFFKDNYPEFKNDEKNWYLDDNNSDTRTTINVLACGVRFWEDEISSLEGLIMLSGDPNMPNETLEVVTEMLGMEFQVEPDSPSGNWFCKKQPLMNSEGEFDLNGDGHIQYVGPWANAQHIKATSLEDWRATNAIDRTSVLTGCLSSNFRSGPNGQQFHLPTITQHSNAFALLKKMGPCEGM